MIDIDPPTEIEKLRTRIGTLEREVGLGTDNGLKHRIAEMEPEIQSIMGELGMGSDNGLKHRLKVAEEKQEEMGRTVVFVSFVNKYIFTPVVVAVLVYAILDILRRS